MCVCACDLADVCVVFGVSPFIRALFPENLEAEKRGRPSTASTKIKVSEGWQGASDHFLFPVAAPPFLVVFLLMELSGLDAFSLRKLLLFLSPRNKPTVWSRR